MYSLDELMNGLLPHHEKEEVLCSQNLVYIVQDYDTMYDIYCKSGQGFCINDIDIENFIRISEKYNNFVTCSDLTNSVELIKSHLINQMQPAINVVQTRWHFNISSSNIIEAVHAINYN